MFVNVNIPSFGELLRKFVFSFKNRIMNSYNLLVNGIVRSATPLFCKIWARWSDILNIKLFIIISVYICIYVLGLLLFFRLIFIHFYMTVYMWRVCYECRMFYHCIIMDLESVNKHLLYKMHSWLEISL